MALSAYIGKRIGLAAGQLLAASIIIFLMVRLIPGDPARIALGTAASEQAVENLRADLGLDGPVWEQYVVWLGDAVMLDWGTSVGTGHSVYALLTTQYPRSLTLATLAIVFTIAISFPLAIVAASNHRTRLDNVFVAFSQVGISIPGFWLGLLLLLVFARYLDILPSSGFTPFLQDPVDSVRHLILPALTLGFVNAAVVTRYLRAEMIEELQKDYVKTAKAMGHPWRRIVMVYAFRNALVPTVTSLGITFGYMVGGVVIIEEVFAYPGIGRQILHAVLNRDYPVVQMGVLLLVGTFIAVNLIVDVIYAYINPKIRY